MIPSATRSAAVGDVAEPLLGVSPAIRAIELEIEFAARSDSKVLITGESGVGKEVIARLIHRSSRRALTPLVTVNCAGIPDSLLESALFGHMRGSFTGAYRDHLGLLEMAHGSTIFLDEIGEMSLRMQALLLRFLENGEIQRVGSQRTQTRVDVRVIAATNRNLLERMTSKDFREDLFYRLNVVHVNIPPLRARREDIPAFLQYFLHVYAERHGVPAPELAPDALARLVAYDWPGNVRELKNAVERLIVRTNSNVIAVKDLRTEVQRSGDRVPDLPRVPVRSIADDLFTRMTTGHESFWHIVYPLFMSRDLTREELRTILRRGLERTGGNYKSLVELFNLEPGDYKRLLNFLRKHQCQVPFQRFRSARPAPVETESGGHRRDPAGEES
jgi:transcriptional regulator with PAS, ATPase and Fis domain